MPFRRSIRRAAALCALVGPMAGCASSDQPSPIEPGNTWMIEAVDQTGVFGTITLERGEVIDLPAEARMGAAVPGATHGILVHIEYESHRAGDAGIGLFDWGARTRQEAVPVAEASVRVSGLVSNAAWPVEPGLGTRLPGSANPLAGWLVIAVTPAELEGQVTLQYQPIVVDLGNGGADARLVSEVVVHDP